MDFLRSVFTRILPLSEASLRRLEAAFSRRELAAGERLVSSGTVCSGVALIERGVFVSQSVVSHREASCDVFAEGDFATDYVSVLTGQPATVDIVALEPAVVRWLPSRRLDELYRSSVELERVGRRLAELQFIQAVHRAGSLLAEPPEVRYARLREERPGLLDRVPLYLVAQWLGVTPESLSRIRRRLVQRRREGPRTVTQRSVTETVASASKSKAASAKAGGPKRPRASREKP